MLTFSFPAESSEKYFPSPLVLKQQRILKLESLYQNAYLTLKTPPGLVLRDVRVDKINSWVDVHRGKTTKQTNWALWNNA